MQCISIIECINIGITSNDALELSSMTSIDKINMIFMISFNVSLEETVHILDFGFHAGLMFLLLFPVFSKFIIFHS